MQTRHTPADSATHIRLESGKNPNEVVPIKQRGRLEDRDGTQTRYYSSSSWLAAAEQHATSAPQNIVGQPQQSLEFPTALIDTLLQEKEVDRLVSWYSEYCHFWYPIVDISNVLSSLSALRVRRAATPGSSALIMAICHAATCSKKASGTTASPDLMSDPPWGKLADQALHVSDYPRRPNFNTMCAAFLLAAPSMAENAHAPDPGPISTLIRTAQVLGLHRDPGSFQIESSEAEIRRIIWWSIHGLDVSYATAHALPALIHPTTYDVPIIADSGRLDHKLITCMARINLVISKTLHDIYGVQQPTREKIRILDEEANTICADEVSNLEDIQDTALVRFLVVSKKMCCWKMTYILHQPYLRCAQWLQDSREKTLQACREYITLFLGSIAEPAFVPYRWILDHFNIRHACAIVLQDLIEHPNSDESDSLRGLVETCFSTSSVDYHPDWTRLNALRSKAWDSNRWITDQISFSDDLDLDASLSDWDPLFASFEWDELLLPEDIG